MSALCLVAALVARVAAASAEESVVDSFFRLGGYILNQEGKFSLVGEAPGSVQPFQIQPRQPFTMAAPSGEQMPSVLEQETFITAPRAPTGLQDQGGVDPTQMLQTSDTLQTVSAQRRAPTVFDAHVRGYRMGQIYTQADGTLWVAAREDVDSMLSKLDPSMIESIAVVPGPYEVRYGPGFSFLNVETISTPRYQNGGETHNRVGVTYRGNGGQLYGRATAYGGGSDYGFIFNYGNRNGADYFAGSDERIPSSYLNQNFGGQLGFDMGNEETLEVRYQRLDQGFTEYAARFFDIDFLGCDNYSINYVNNSPDHAWDRSEVMGWWNHTRYTGNTNSPSKRASTLIGPASHHVIDRVDYAINPAGFNPASGQVGGFMGNTNGALKSTGGRGEILFGEVDDTHLSFGADVQYLEQFIYEFYSARTPPFNGSATFPFAEFPFFTNMPRATGFDAGLYSEFQWPVREYWQATVGARCDFVHTDAAWPRPDGSLWPLRDSFAQDDALYAFFLRNDVNVAEHWDAHLAFGHAQRIPTLWERYADGIFLAIIQDGFSRVIGDPTTDKERVWQIDIGLDATYDNVRGRVSAFQSWILDYVTFRGNLVQSPEGARLLQAMNTPLATLTGFEAYGEMDLNRQWTAFASAAYVEGHDITLGQYLWGIPPFEGRAGLRFHDPDGGQRWGIEGGARVVATQNRLGLIRSSTGGTAVIPIEQRTGGFTTAYIRGYWNIGDNFNLIGGIDNVFDRNYLEHLDMRLPADAPFPGTYALAPGFTPYVGVERTY